MLAQWLLNFSSQRTAAPEIRKIVGSVLFNTERQNQIHPLYSNMHRVNSGSKTLAFAVVSCNNLQLFVSVLDFILSIHLLTAAYSWFILPCSHGASLPTKVDVCRAIMLCLSYLLWFFFGGNCVLAVSPLNNKQNPLVGFCSSKRWMIINFLSQWKLFLTSLSLNLPHSFQ